jgi:pyruvate kinase
VGTRKLLRDLRALRERLLDVEAGALAAVPDIHAEFRRSACNLAHYAALRSREARSLQTSLARFGLSSLGRAEGNVLANLDAVIGLLHVAAGTRAPRLPRSRGTIPLLGGRRILERHAAQLLGRPPAGRSDRILVTLPSEAADDAAFVRGLVAAGMDCARVNCAHDDPDAWARMIRHVRTAARSARRNVRVFMDLAGPKLRTGPLTPGPEVLHWRPQRDEVGRVTQAARLWLVPADEPYAAPGPADAVVPVTPDWLSRRRVGDTVTLIDARGSARMLRITGTAGRGRWAHCAQSTYVVSGTRLESVPRDPQSATDSGAVGRLAPAERPIVLRAGDTIRLTRELEPGEGAQHDGSGRPIVPARIGCTLPEVFDAARPGQSVWFDDGKIGGRIVSAGRDEIGVRIEHAAPGGSRLRADKGINLPDTPVSVPAITVKDAGDLQFVVRHADAVAMSFLRSRGDVEDLQERLAAFGRPDFGIVLKIETRPAFDRLPDLLFTAMRSPRVGVMIARGDLAVECGWERLAELQEEILWFCEAAHVPVIWATQVLDGMARTGQPTRAEVTDAAMAVRAECVMLNKGPHIREAVAALDDILRRMEAHQRKKSPLLRRLHVAERFVAARRPPGRRLRNGKAAARR